MSLGLSFVVRVILASGPPAAVVVSDGSPGRPFCTHGAAFCNWTTAAQGECSNALCRAAGYPGGRFVNASNNPCTALYQGGMNHNYFLGYNCTYASPAYENAQITARCTFT